MRISDGSSDVCSSELPKGEQIEDAGEKARLGDPEQEAQDIEARRRPREAERQRDEAPRPDDPRKPKPWPDALEDQVAGNLEDTIAEEEQRRPQPVGGFAEPKVADQDRKSTRLNSSH